MDDKEKFDALMALARFRFEIREKRRAIEWKISVGLWAVLAASIVYLKAQPLLLLSLIWISIVIVHAWFWVRVNYVSNERSARTMYYHAERADRLVLGGSEPEGPCELDENARRWGFLKHEPALFQPIATALLGLAVIVASR